MTYACSAWELVADIYLFKLQHMVNKVVHTTGKFPRWTPVCDLHPTFNLPYVHNFITKLCRLEAEVTQNHENEHVRSIGQGEARQKL
jgi:hypothetical protein